MKLTRNWALALAAMLVCVNLATPQERPTRPARQELSGGVRALKDLAYIEGGHERHRLDLYLPEKAEGRLPVVVWIHGGAWQGGSKEGCPAVPLVAKGYAVASINYRLSQHAVFPAQIEDCKAAIRWLRANSAKYHLDPDHIGVWGESAGGHLVAMLGTTGSVKGLEGKGGNLDQSSRVQCVVDWFGPTDMVTIERQASKPDSPVTRLLGGPVQENREKARKASPLTYVSKESAPFLIMHGDKDDIVPLSQSEVLTEALKKAGAEVSLQIVKGNGHGGPGFTTPESRKLIEDFLAKHLHKNGITAETEAKFPKQRPPITISKETTCITGPLRKDGYVDYVAALNERFRASVTTENNVAIPFLKAMGPGEIDLKHRDEFCRMLGIETLPEKGDYFIGLDKYIKGLQDAEKPGTGGDDKGADLYWDQLTQAMERPWSKKEFPILAEWLAANERPMELLATASKRPRRYDPLISENDDPIGIISIILSNLQQYRAVARTLTVRAMLRANDGKVDEAWEDLLVCHRLGRLFGQGPTLVEALVAINVDGMACAGNQAFFQYTRLTPAQINKMRADLDSLPPMPKMVDKIDVAERFQFLDCAGMVARKGLSSLDRYLEGGPHGLLKSLVDAAVKTVVDWDQVLRMGNSWYDRMVDAYGKPMRSERTAALGKIDEDLKTMAVAAKDWKLLGLSILGGQRNAVTEQIGRVLVSLFLSGLSPAAKAEDRATMQVDLTKLALALAAFHADRDAYPERLADLVPKYAAEIPKDIFLADSELHYRQEGGGYLLYSVGVNGKDDGGKKLDDCDDLVVRVPAATAKKP